MHTDPEGIGKIGLREPDEPAQGSHVPRLKLPTDDALTLAPAEGPMEVSLRKLGNVFHGRVSANTPPDE